VPSERPAFWRSWVGLYDSYDRQNNEHSLLGIVLVLFGLSLIVGSIVL
jgi:hypothetical protein